MVKGVSVRILYWSSWFTRSSQELCEYLGTKFEDVMFSFNLEPIEVEKGNSKPFEVYVENNLIYSNLTPIDGEKGPVLFVPSKWYGDPDPKHLARIENSIENVE